jgi:hypothetical protein
VNPGSQERGVQVAADEGFVTRLVVGYSDNDRASATVGEANRRLSEVAASVLQVRLLLLEVKLLGLDLRGSPACEDSLQFREHRGHRLRLLWGK